MIWTRWAFVSVAVIGLVGCREAEQTPQESAPQESAPQVSAPKGAALAEGELVRVDDPSVVCMVNDRYMGTPQIAVPVEGKTYFGCCAMCKQKLENGDSARTARDPVSGARVDKAVAVIGRHADGRVLYFENETNMRAYRL